MEWSLSEVFESTAQPPPGPAIQLNGIDGGKAIIGASFVREKDGRIGFGTTTGEKLSLTPKKVDEIQANLRRLDPQKWEVLTKLPSPIFRYRLHLLSDTESPNNGKKSSYFLLKVGMRAVQKVMPGQRILLGEDFQVEDISDYLGISKLDLVYKDGMYMTFFDPKGQFISQATGRIIIEPTSFTRGSVFVSLLVIILALLHLLKNIFLAPKDFEEIKAYYQREKRRK